MICPYSKDPKRRNWFLEREIGLKHGDYALIIAMTSGVESTILLFGRDFIRQIEVSGRFDVIQSANRHC